MSKFIPVAKLVKLSIRRSSRLEAVVDLSIFSVDTGRTISVVSTYALTSSSLSDVSDET